MIYVFHYFNSLCIGRAYGNPLLQYPTMGTAFGSSNPSAPIELQSQKRCLAQVYCVQRSQGRAGAFADHKTAPGQSNSPHPRGCRKRVSSTHRVCTGSSYRDTAVFLPRRSSCTPRKTVRPSLGHCPVKFCTGRCPKPINSRKSETKHLVPVKL